MSSRGRGTLPYDTILPPLPAPPATAERRLLEEMHRGDPADRTAIHAESDRTIDDRIGTSARVSEERDRLAVGSRLTVQRRVAAGAEQHVAEEMFEIEEELSTEHNISGDVYRARRYWDGTYYGDVVLKMPKSVLRRTLSPLELEEASATELRHLTRFAAHPIILSTVGKPFVWRSGLVIQVEYQPWSLSEYLQYFSDEELLTAAVVRAGWQCASAVAFMAELRDDEGPEGYAHVDLKTTHLRLDYKAQGSSAGEWVLSLIDLDSVMPVGPIPIHETKYNLAAVDPEKFMPLHDPGCLVTVSPAETIYSVGLTFLSAGAHRLGVSTRRRGFKVVGLEDEGEGTRLVDEPALRAAIERVRAVDELNLIKVYFANKTRRMLAGRFDQDPEGLRDLLARHVDRQDVRQEALEEASASRESSRASVHPQVFSVLRECLQPRAVRLPPRQIEALFASVPTG